MLTDLAADEPYMTFDDGNVVLGVPSGGSLRFKEGTTQWTFADVSSAAAAHTDSAVDALSDTMMQQLSNAVVQTKACCFCC
jgi:hypothetical protein